MRGRVVKGPNNPTYERSCGCGGLIGRVVWTQLVIGRGLLRVYAELSSEQGGCGCGGLIGRVVWTHGPNNPTDDPTTTTTTSNHHCSVRGLVGV